MKHKMRQTTQHYQEVERVRLLEYRKRLGMSQRDVARKAGCSEEYICWLETRRRTLPNVYVAQRIARAVGATVEELFPLEEEPVNRRGGCQRA